jgi:hypothetical protein
MKKIILLTISFISILAVQAKVVYVDTDATGSNDGTSWANAYTDLQIAFFRTLSSDDVWIASGTYTPSAGDRNTSFSWDRKKLKVYGGFAGTETAISQRDMNTAATILSGDIGVKGDDSDNSYTVLRAGSGSAFGGYADSSWIDGVTISDGNSDFFDPEGGGFGDKSLNNGGGFFLGEYAPYLRFNNCKFTNNYARTGGAISLIKDKVLESTVLFYNCSFTNNSADINSFAYVYSDNDKPLNAYFINCLIADNHSISTNTSEGILMNYTSFGKFANLYMYSATITGNSTDADTSGSNSVALISAGKNLSSTGATNLVLVNSIIYNNEVNTYLKKDRSSYLPNAGLANCIMEESKLPTGLPIFDMIYQDPDFIGGAGHLKYMPSRKSPAIDASKAVTASVNAVFTTTDLAGNTRPTDTDSIDLGCYENPEGKEVIQTSVKHYNTLKATVYPNPATNTISVKGIQGTARISIINALGAEVMETCSTQEIDISALPRGFYTIISDQNGALSQAKFIKE